MSLSVGIVGLPNVGKSTIFNALTKSQVPAQNYPFCTIDPNIGIVPVPDARLAVLDSMVHSKRIVPSVVQFVDIAGLVKGASKGEGLGNQFLAHIREVDAIVHILRVFKDDDVTHVEGRIDPIDDLSIISTEIALKDLETIPKLISAEEKKLRIGDKNAKKRIEVLTTIANKLQKGGIEQMVLSDDDAELIHDISLLSLKPRMYVLNVSDEELTRDFAFPFPYIRISAKFEAELADIPDEEKKEFLQMAGVEQSGLELLAKAAYETLGLINFFTAGEMEVRSWTIQKGMKAPDAAGVIHTDFRDKFIRLETVAYTDYIADDGWEKAKEKGHMRSEGKDYIVADGDIVIVRHS